MWTRKITNDRSIQHETDGITVALTAEPATAVSLLTEPLEAIVLHRGEHENFSTIMFIGDTSKIVSVTVPVPIHVLESHLTTASYEYHLGVDNDA
jgi:hypothetical protein